jgi:hypothetical protein
MSYGRRSKVKSEIVKVLRRIIAPVYITLSLLRLVVSNFNHVLFAFAFFSLRQDSNCSVQFLAVRRIVHVEFKLHRLGNGLSEATPCCSANRFQRSSAITSIRLETERFSKEAICSSLFRCSSRTACS